jgi:acylphosphatase
MAAPAPGSQPAAADARVSFDFRVTGKVQGVFFRKHAAAAATELGLAGWVANAADGAVVGVAQGPPAAAGAFKTWLATVGSPRSVIEGAAFANERALPRGGPPEFAGFAIRR